MNCGIIRIMKQKRIWIICILLLGALLVACGLDDANGEPVSETAATAAPTAVSTPAPAEQDDEVAVIATPVPTEPPKTTSLHVETPTDGQTLADRIAAERTIETVEIDRGMLSNDDIAMLLKRFPNVKFLYEVQIGYDYILPDAESLTLEDGTVSEILSAAKCLPNLRLLDIGACTPEELAEAKAAIRDAELCYAVRLFGQTVDRDAETLDLTALDSLDAEALAAALPYLPMLRTVELGERNDPEAMQAFINAFPSLECRYTCRFDYLGMTLTDDIETLDLSGKKITDTEELKRTIERLPKLRRVEMIGCGQNDAAMAALCDAYPNVRFIWEIDLGFWGKLRTDATAFSTRYGRKSETLDRNRLTSEKAQYIRYCTDLVALDLGHQKLTDITFLRPLKKLRVLILADNYISDIGVLAQFSELEYIELFMNRISDLSPLSGLEHLQDLNICSNKISDFSPLYGIKTLGRLWYANNKFTKSVHAKLKEELPDCVLNHSDAGTDGGWRYVGNGKKEKSEREQWKNAFFEGAPRYE